MQCNRTACTCFQCQLSFENLRQSPRAMPPAHEIACSPWLSTPWPHMSLQFVILKGSQYPNSQRKEELFKELHVKNVILQAMLITHSRSLEVHSVVWFVGKKSYWERERTHLAGICVTLPEMVFFASGERGNRLSKTLKIDGRHVLVREKQQGWQLEDHSLVAPPGTSRIESSIDLSDFALSSLGYGDPTWPDMLDKVFPALWCQELLHCFLFGIGIPGRDAYLSEHHIWGSSILSCKGTKYWSTGPKYPTTPTRISRALGATKAHRAHSVIDG